MNNDGGCDAKREEPFIAVDVESDQLLRYPEVRGACSDTQKELEALAELCRAKGIRPAEVRCRDERTYALVKDFYEKIGARVYISDEMELLDDIEESMFDQFEELAELDDEEYSEMAEKLEMMSDRILAMGTKELEAVPKENIEMIRSLLDNGLFDPDKSEKLRKKLGEV